MRLLTSLLCLMIPLPALGQTTAPTTYQYRVNIPAGARWAVEGRTEVRRPTTAQVDGRKLMQAEQYWVMYLKAQVMVTEVRQGRPVAMQAQIDPASATWAKTLTWSHHAPLHLAGKTVPLVEQWCGTRNGGPTAAETEAVILRRFIQPDGRAFPEGELAVGHRWRRPAAVLDEYLAAMAMLGSASPPKSPPLEATLVGIRTTDGRPVAEVTWTVLPQSQFDEITGGGSLLVDVQTGQRLSSQLRLQWIVRHRANDGTLTAKAVTTAEALQTFRPL